MRVRLVELALQERKPRVSGISPRLCCTADATKLLEVVSELMAGRASMQSLSAMLGSGDEVSLHCLWGSCIQFQARFSSCLHHFQYLLCLYEINALTCSF